MRSTFSRCLVQAAKSDPRVVLLTGDHGYALFDDFRKECPDQYVNAGIAEQNMVGVAAGLAKVGFFPIVYGLNAFVPIRVLEQIKIDLCYERLPAILVGDGAGVVYGQLGTSHQSTEDIASLRAIPNISIYSPADAMEMEQCFSEALGVGSTAYIRMGKADLGAIHLPAESIGSTAPIQLIKGKVGGVSFVATGSMLKTAKILASKIGDVSLWSIPRLKPMSEDELDPCLRGFEKVVTFEEHSIYGGLGSLLAERIASFKNAPQLLRVGIEDRFSELCGSYDFLMDWHGLSQMKVEERVTQFLAVDQ